MENSLPVRLLGTVFFFSNRYLEIQQILIKARLCASHCDQHTAVNMTEIPALVGLMI